MFKFKIEIEKINRREVLGHDFKYPKYAITSNSNYLNYNTRFNIISPIISDDFHFGLILTYSFRVLIDV